MTWQQQPGSTYQDAGTESDARTFDITHFADLDAQRSVAISELKSDLQAKTETIGRLRFDIEQLRSHWLGLKAEIAAREEMTADLNSELDRVRSALQRKDKLLQKRDQLIKSLKVEIRQRNEDYRVINAAHKDLEKQVVATVESLDASDGDQADSTQRDLAELAGQVASRDTQIEGLCKQLQRTEGYADGIRRKLHDHMETVDDLQLSREALQRSLTRANERIAQLSQTAEEQEASNRKLSDQLNESRENHADEIRMMRFEIGEAQETVAQHELVTEQLALDLVDSRGFKDELERMLSVREKHNHSQIEELEERVGTLQGTLAEYEQKLSAKSDAINCLLSELATRNPQVDAIGQIEDVIHNIDDRMAERTAIPSISDRDRISRVLIGNIDDQELRFPLFKDRLTIGRARQNDIHLKADYVSRRHAVIVTEGKTTRVIDWGSRNGVFVNSRRITEHFLRGGDVVTIGTADFRYEERPKRDI